MSARLRAVIVDDEPLALARMRRLIERDGRVDIVAECGTGADAIDALRTYRPDVAFLDVQMPGARQREHAEAVGAQAADYLLKPLSYPRLRAANERLQPAGEAPSPKYAVRLTVQAGARLRVLDVGAIDCLVAQANYVEVEAGDQRHRVRDTLAGLEARLDPEAFVRIHRSRIVRIAAIRDLELLDSGELLLRLENGRRLSTGRRYRERLRQAVGLAS